MSILSQIQQSISLSGMLPVDLSRQSIKGESQLGVVNELAVNAMQVAVGAVQGLVADRFSVCSSALIDCPLVDLWCSNSIFPQDWQAPEVWDKFALDYRTADGWLRLHTNAPHHRQAALSVLGNPTNIEQARETVLAWRAQELEEAVVAANGCAAQLRSREQWLLHPQGKAVVSEPIVDWQVRDLECASSWQPVCQTRPLSGLKVLDLTRVIAGPVATRFLASLGAEVLRIDPPFWTEHGKEMDLTVGKQCAGLDLRKNGDLAQLKKLLASAHVLVHGYRKDALAGLGLDPQTLQTINPGLICVGLNAYGATGPWQNRRGFDSLVQRSAGLAVANEDKVFELPYQVLDHATGYLMAATAIQTLRLQQNHKQTASAHLSLARQAKLLSDSDVDTVSLYPHRPNGMQLPKQYASQCHVETTAWGPVLRLPLPMQIDTVNMHWDRPANKLRSVAPAWI